MGYFCFKKRNYLGCAGLRKCCWSACQVHKNREVIMQIPLSKSWVTEEDIKAVEVVLMTPYMSLGPKLLEFESMLAGVAKRKYAVAVNSGTSALHLIIRSLGIKDRDKVITTPFSFIASSNCILFERAKPVFVDIDPKTYNINPNLIEEKITEKTKAILAVHVFTQPTDWDKLKEIAKKMGKKGREKMEKNFALMLFYCRRRNFLRTLLKNQKISFKKFRVLEFCLRGSE